MSIAIFRVNDCDWWLGETAQQVLDAYCEAMGLTPEEALDEGDCLPVMLTDAELDTLQFRNHDDTRHTFREQLDRALALGVVVPCPFASTEY